MLIHSVGATSQAGWARPSRAAITQPSVQTDTVQLAGQPLPATTQPLSLAAQGVASASQASPVPAVAQPTLEELRQAAERLQSQGLKLQHRPKVLFFTLDYRDSSPAKTAKLCDRPNRVRVFHPEHKKPLLVNRNDDLILLDALYGKSDISQLSDPPRARALLALEKIHPDKVNAYSGYLSGNRISLTLDSGTAETGEQVIAMAYLRGLVSTPEGLTHGEEAHTLRELEKAGFIPMEGTLTAYKRLGTYHSKVDISHQGESLLKVSHETLKDTEATLALVRAMDEARQRLTEGLGENASQALDLVRNTSGELDVPTRVDLVEKAFATCPHPHKVYGAVVECADSKEQVGRWLELGQRFDPSGEAWEALRALKEVIPEGQTPSPALVERYETMRQVTEQCDSAALCASALGEHGHQPADPGAYYSRLQELCEHDAWTAAAFAALASAGRLAEDCGLLEEMLQAAPNPPAAIDAYPTLQARVRPEDRELFLDVWKTAPECSMEDAWQAIDRPDASQRAIRAAIWKAGMEIVGGPENFRRGNRYTELLKELPDGPELAWRGEMLNRVVAGSQGDPGAAARVWENLQDSSDLETAVRLYEATGNQDQAARAAEILTRNDLGDATCYEDRREALASLIGALGGNVDRGLEAYRHLIEVSGKDMKASARDFSLLLAACGNEDQGRLAYGAVRAAAPSPTSAESLALALKSQRGDLAGARPLWTSLEAKSDYSPAERRENMRVAGEAKLEPEQAKELYLWMTSARLDKTGRKAVTQILNRGGDLEPRLELIQAVTPKSDERAGRLKALAGLPDLSTRQLVEVLDVVSARAGEKDFSDFLQAVNGQRNKVSRESVETLLRTHQPGESFKLLGELQSASGEGFERVRARLGEGSVEGDLAGNTRWLLEQKQRVYDLDKALEAWETVKTPVGSETTAERQAAFDRLGSDCEAWTALTTWMQPGETLTAAVDAALSLREKTVKLLPRSADWTSLLGQVRHHQMQGALEHLSLERVADKMEGVITGLMAENVLNAQGRTDVEAVVEALCDSVGKTGIETGDHHVVIGGVRVATR